MSFSLRIAGHRGMGCTDSVHAMMLGNHLSRSPENTIESLSAALQLCDLIETDIVQTRDNQCVLIHSGNVAEHVQLQFRPHEASRIEQMTLDKVLQLRLGVEGNYRIPTLAQLLGVITELRPEDDVVLNLEIKSAAPTYVLEIIRAAKFPLQRIRFSSFSYDTLNDLAALAPDARIGMLFGKGECTISALEKFSAFEAIHPEIHDITPEVVAYAAQKKLSIASWCWQEESPVENPAFAAATQNAITLCTQANVPLTLITDYSEDMRLAIRG